MMLMFLVGVDLGVGLGVPSVSQLSERVEPVSAVTCVRLVESKVRLVESKVRLVESKSESATVLVLLNVSLDLPNAPRGRPSVMSRLSSEATVGVDTDIDLDI